MPRENWHCCCSASSVHPPCPTLPLGLQSEDKSVVVWRCDDWSVVAVVRAPYTKLVTSTFSTRMSWSPDGSFLATGAAGGAAVGFVTASA